MLEPQLLLASSLCPEQISVTVFLSWGVTWGQELQLHRAVVRTEGVNKRLCSQKTVVLALWLGKVFVLQASDVEINFLNGFLKITSLCSFSQFPSCFHLP